MHIVVFQANHFPMGCCCLLMVLSLVATSPLHAADAVFVKDAAPQMLLEHGAGEGPAWHPELGLLFSGEGGTGRLTLDGRQLVFRKDSGTNGLLFDHQGRLICCEAAARRVTRVEADGSITVLTARFQGKQYNQPNDLAMDSSGRIYFSDPRYGDRANMEIKDDTGHLVEGVYRIDPDSKVTRIITHEADRPNGLLVTPDDRYMYVADNNNNSKGGARKLWRFDLQNDGSIKAGSRQLIFDWKTGRGPDGMAIDSQGRLYVAGGRNRAAPPFETATEMKGGIYVFSPAGKLQTFLPIPRDEVTNCGFGDADLKTLYITAGGTLWSIRTTTPGQPVWPQAIASTKNK